MSLSSILTSDRAVISDAFKQELLTRVDIVDVIDPRVPLKKAGANFSACCPFHTEKTPSFSVSPSKQFYHCFGCGVSGNAISFLMEYGGLGYIDAVRELAESVGLKMPAFEGPSRGARADQPEGPDLGAMMDEAQAYYKDQLKSSPRAIEYLKSRGLTGAIAARFGMGFAPDAWQGLQAVFPKYDDKALVDCGLVIVNDEGRRYDRFRDRVMFPILSQRGQVIGFGGRVIPGAGEKGDNAGPKYLNSPETPLFEKGRELYGLPQARESIRARSRVFVVEGYMDVVALAQHGVENVVATLGTATTPTHVMKLLRQTNEIVFGFDGDNAGRKAAWHALEVSLGCVPDGKLIRFLFLPQEDDPDSYVRAHGAEAFGRMADQAQPLSSYFLAELTKRSGVESAEGRAKLVSDARPLVEKMTAPILQAQLMHDIAAAAQLSSEELSRLFGINMATARTRYAQSSNGFQRGNGRNFQSSQFREPRAADRNRASLALEGRLEQFLLQSVLAHPTLASEVPIEFLDGARPELVALAAVIDYLGEHGTQIAGLTETFRSDSGRDPAIITAIEQAMVAILTVEPTPESFREAVGRLALRRLTDELNALSRKAKSEKLNATELARYPQLPAAIQKLRTELGNSSSVL